MLKKLIPLLAVAVLILTVSLSGYLLTQGLLGEPAPASGAKPEPRPLAPADLYAGENPHGTRSLASLTVPEQQELNSARQVLDLALADYLRKEEELGLLSQAVNQQIGVKIKELLDLHILTGTTPNRQDYSPGEKSM